MNGVPCGPLIRPFGPPSPRWGEEKRETAAPYPGPSRGSGRRPCDRFTGSIAPRFAGIGPHPPVTLICLATAGRLCVRSMMKS
ncbi:hypothetical protein GFL86_33385 [Rhizobium laguerreae]|nr:hypothetical protein [Rhizobium laguerreae]